MFPLYDESNWQKLLRRPATENGRPECLPRITKYASPEARALGLTPMEEYPDALIPWEKVQETIERCHREKIFPLYHQENAGVMKEWYQDGYGYCWAYGLTAAVMGCRAAEGQPPVRLSPFSLGWLVNWRNSGYYCDRAIAGARERGIAPADYVPEYELNRRRFKDGWEQEAKKYRPLEWWDVDTSRGQKDVIRQCLTILATGRPLYIAYNWWGHALECVGMRWDGSKVIWQVWNSHGDGVIELAGSRGVPDEAYGVRATSWGPGETSEKGGPA